MKINMKAGNQFSTKTDREIANCRKQENASLMKELKEHREIKKSRKQENISNMKDLKENRE
eukprot:c10749_g1_i2 orf=340-522(+)